jgi:hypothetical protein
MGIFMSRASLLSPTVFVLAILVGCGQGLSVGPDAGASAARINAGSLTLEDAALTDHWIVRLNEAGACPKSDRDWTITPLFEADEKGEMPGFLARYCVFESTNGSEQAPSEHTYGESDHDHLVIAGMSLADDQDIWKSTLNQVQPFPDYNTDPPATARLTIIDSSPTGLPALSFEGPNDHGLRLAAIAQAAVCDADGDCVVDVGSQLAMGYLETSVGWVRDAGGGNIGSPTDLALAIQKSVLAWQQSSDHSPLVLNLSLGWHPEAGGTSSDMAPPIEAVYDALRYASCQGALVVAAVGNDDTPHGEAHANGPILPAAWERLAAPSEATCSTLLGDWYADKSPVGSETYTPLIYAVGAVDIDRAPLGNQRSGSQPRHVAAGSHLAGQSDGKGGTILTPITGTSASTVVVAAAAAVLRSHAPSLNAHEVMRVLRTGAHKKSKVKAQYCYDDGSPNCGHAYIVRVCEALTYACGKGLASCPSTYSSFKCEKTAGPLDPAPISTTAKTPVLTLTAKFATTCSDGSTVFYDVENDDSNCPSAEFYAATALPMTLPMPHGSECPWCPAYEGALGQVELLTPGGIENLLNPTIAVFRSSGVERYALGPGLTGTENVVILPDSLDGSVIAVILEYTTPGELAFITEPLYVTW